MVIQSFVCATSRRSNSCCVSNTVLVSRNKFGKMFGIYQFCSLCTRVRFSFRFTNLCFLKLGFEVFYLTAKVYYSRSQFSYDGRTVTVITLFALFYFADLFDDTVFFTDSDRVSWIGGR